MLREGLGKVNAEGTRAPAIQAENNTVKTSKQAKLPKQAHTTSFTDSPYFRLRIQVNLEGGERGHPPGPGNWGRGQQEAAGVGNALQDAVRGLLGSEDVFCAWQSLGLVQLVLQGVAVWAGWRLRPGEAGGAGHI